MSYPPPPYADAVTGTPVAGEAITGAWWAYPLQTGAQLGAYPPSISIVSSAGEVIDFPEAGLQLGAYAPAVVVAQNATVTVTKVPGLLLGATVPALQVSSTIGWVEPGLLLGMNTARFIGQQWLYDLVCAEEDLVPAGELSFDLEPVGCR